MDLTFKRPFSSHLTKQVPGSTGFFNSEYNAQIYTYDGALEILRSLIDLNFWHEIPAPQNRDGQ